MSLLANSADSLSATIQPTTLPTEHVQDDVEVIIAPRGGPQQLGDVPPPDLIGACRHKRGSLKVGMAHDVSAFPNTIPASSLLQFHFRGSRQYV